MTFLSAGIAQQQRLDPYFNDVTLLLHMDGADGSTTITDSSSYGISPTGVAGNCQIDTAESKFGGASCVFDGSGDFVYWSWNDAKWNWYSDDHTIELWVRAPSWATWESSDDPVCIGKYNSGTSSNYWSFGPVADGTIRFKYYNGASVFVNSTGTLSVDTWHHIALSHYTTDNTIRLFINGVLDGSATVVGTPQSPATNGLAIGQYNNRCMTGWVDDVRITHGVCRYITNFAPPSQAFPNG